MKKRRRGVVIEDEDEGWGLGGQGSLPCLHLFTFHLYCYIHGTVLDLLVSLPSLPKSVDFLAKWVLPIWEASHV